MIVTVRFASLGPGTGQGSLIGLPGILVQVRVLLNDMQRFREPLLVLWSGEEFLEAVAVADDPHLANLEHNLQRPDNAYHHRNATDLKEDFTLAKDSPRGSAITGHDDGWYLQLPSPQYALDWEGQRKS